MKHTLMRFPLFDVFQVMTCTTAVILFGMGLCVSAIQDIFPLGRPSAVIVIVLVLLSMSYTLAKSIIVRRKGITQTPCGRLSSKIIVWPFLILPKLQICIWGTVVGACVVSVTDVRDCGQINPRGVSWSNRQSCRSSRILTLILIVVVAIICIISNEIQVGTIIQSISSSTARKRWFGRHITKDSEASFESSQSSTSGTTVEKRISRAEHEQWLQRRNSASSLNATYPSFGQPITKNGCNTIDSDLDRLLNGIKRERSGRFTHSTRSTCPSDTMCLVPGCIYCVGTIQSQRYSTGTWPLAAPIMSNVQQPPIKFITPSIAQSLQGRHSSIAIEPVPEDRELSPPPPLWCPSSMRHAPLSADPTIRALSSGEWSGTGLSSAQNIRGRPRGGMVSSSSRHVRRNCSRRPHTGRAFTAPSSIYSFKSAGPCVPRSTTCGSLSVKSLHNDGQFFATQSISSVTPPKSFGNTHQGITTQKCPQSSVTNPQGS